MNKAAIGILMLDTHFPRPPGDIGNALTWDFPVKMRRVGGASAQKVVHEDPRALLDRFVEVGRDLVAEGCVGLTTSCGFLSLMQDELKDRIGVPFASSPLMQIPMVEALLPKGQEVGVLTISQESLSPAHLRAAGSRADVAMRGLPPDGAFARAIFDDGPKMDLAACQREMTSIAQDMLRVRPEVGAFVLECTNMAPFAAEITAKTGRPVFAITSFINWFYAGLQPQVYA